MAVAYLTVLFQCDHFPPFFCKHFLLWSCKRLGLCFNCPVILSFNKKEFTWLNFQYLKKQNKNASPKTKLLLIEFRCLTWRTSNQAQKIGYLMVQQKSWVFILISFISFYVIMLLIYFFSTCTENSLDSTVSCFCLSVVLLSFFFFFFFCSAKKTKQNNKTGGVSNCNFHV